MLHVEGGERPRQAVRHGDDGAFQIDRAGERRLRQQRPPDRQVAVHRGGDDAAVRVAAVADLQSDVDGEVAARLDADRARPRDGAACGQASCQRADRRAPLPMAMSARMSSMACRSRDDEACARRRHRAADLRRTRVAAHRQIGVGAAGQRQARRREARTGDANGAPPWRNRARANAC